MHVCVQMSTGFIKKAEHEVYKCPVRNWNQVPLSGILLGNNGLLRMSRGDSGCAFTFNLYRSRQSTLKDCKGVKEKKKKKKKRDKKKRGPEETYSMLLCDYRYIRASITIVHSNTRKYHEFVAIFIVSQPYCTNRHRKCSSHFVGVLFLAL